ncbi:MAG: acyl carrier protein [Candidatus Omnitrophota bacterium]
MEEKVKEVIVKLLGIKNTQIDPNVKLADSLGIDSTEMVEINIALEKAFGVKLQANEVTKFSSLKDIASAIEKKQTAK